MNRITLKKENNIVSIQVVKEQESKSILYITKQKENGLADVDPIIFKTSLTSSDKPYELAVTEAEKKISKYINKGFIKI